MFGKEDFTPVSTTRSRILPTGALATSRTLDPRNSERKKPSCAGGAGRGGAALIGIGIPAIVGTARVPVNESRGGFGKLAP
jgi:hypothetical protein